MNQDGLQIHLAAPAADDAPARGGLNGAVGEVEDAAADEEGAVARPDVVALGAVEEGDVLGPECSVFTDADQRRVVEGGVAATRKLG